ncbi:MAG: hypothetical protein NVV70_14140 [Cellulomonas sp.]|uniref:CdiA C-terminal tRNase domain-containing protein n=1 Tax=Cellulomonas gelida TaxID=1712 RepID=A0A4Y3KPP9_9CELL|nr:MULTISPECIES: hypothetical protein [Cellulomonas]MCR6649213.1 hypothetical protein [Cellulomonas sp.]GEA85145.1 hypothetical protein CGE01nite_23960 [Cellulomonas gelida]GGL20203.1 hypothetical protein GCM10009774_08140 [Cellulomonas gelida]
MSELTHEIATPSAPEPEPVPTPATPALTPAPLSHLPVGGEFLGPDDALPASPTPGTPAYLLAFDPAVGKFRQSEYETARRIIDERQVRLRRAEPGARHDWVDQHGTTYDAVGNFPAKFFDKQWDKLKEQIVLHLKKAQVVPVDVAQFTEEQRVLVREFVRGLANVQVVIVGDK